MTAACCHTFVLNEPYEQARGKIRSALRHQRLRVCFELDVSTGIFRSAGVQLPRSSVLGVDCPYQLLEAFVADPAAAIFFPLHVLISEHGSETNIRILAPQALRAAGLSTAICIPVHRTLRRIANILISVDASRSVPASPLENEATRA